MSRPLGDHETDQEADGLTIAAAAHRLGVSENAVRQRIKRASIDARKIEGVWRVWLPDSADHEAGRSRPSDDKTPDYQDIGRDKTSDQEADHQATSPAAAVESIPALIAQFESIRDQWLRPFVEDLNAKSERIGQLQERLSTTEQRLAAAEQERDELRRLMEDTLLFDPEPEPINSQANNSRQSLRDSHTDEGDSLFYGAENPEKPPASPETRDVAPGRADPPNVSPESNQPASNAGRSVFEDLWRWIRGR